MVPLGMAWFHVVAKRDIGWMVPRARHVPTQFRRTHLIPRARPMPHVRGCAIRAMFPTAHHALIRRSV